MLKPLVSRPGSAVVGKARLGARLKLPLALQLAVPVAWDLELSAGQNEPAGSDEGKPKRN